MRQRAEIDRSLIARSREALFEANSPIQRWYNIMYNIGYDIVHCRSLLTDTMVKYLDKDITKQELSHLFFSEQEAAKREALYEDIIGCNAEVPGPDLSDQRLSSPWISKPSLK